MAERLQDARDFVFAAPDSAQAERDSAILLRTIDLRDMLLASRLDLELLGSDTIARWLLDRAAEGLNRIASRLDAAAAALRREPRPLRLPPTMPIAGSNTRRWPPAMTAPACCR